jgi:RimJ/RimL family protein N-acetyltransferase
MMKSNILISKNLELKVLSLSYLDEYQDMLCEDECRHFTGTQSPVPTLDQIKNWLSSREEAENRYDWAIINKSCGLDSFVGEIVLSNIDEVNLKASLRIGLYRDRNKGFGTEAVESVLNFAFKTLDLKLVDLEVYEFNHRAIHTYKKIGFKVTGMQEESLETEEKPVNAIDMSILSTDFLDRKNKD